MAIPKDQPLTTVTREVLAAVMPLASQSKLDLFAAPLADACAEYSIDTPARVAAFLAQIAHESGSLKFVRELATGDAYEGRKDLGNTQPGDGRRFKGRGLIQITGRTNYQAVGIALGLDLIHDPAQLEQPGPACRSAGWFWKSRNLNPLADAGFFDTITKRINGGLNGKADRDAYYERAKKALGV
jgi:putative chitinase